MTRVIPKLTVQKLLKQMRKEKEYSVAKIQGGYEVTNSEGKRVMRAMNGHKGYLCRWDTDLINIEAK